MNHPRGCAGKRAVALTPRERDIATYLVTGKSNKYIAIELNISSRTAEAHRARIFRKMGVRNAMELACRMCPYSGCND
ncbi:LuxR C-terminal-related transcriptional regulator [Bordetella sputigena]